MTTRALDEAAAAARTALRTLSSHDTLILVACHAGTLPSPRGLSAQKVWVTGARRWGDDGASARCPQRRPTEPASARARNVRHPDLLRAKSGGWAPTADTLASSAAVRHHAG